MEKSTCDTSVSESAHKEWVRVWGDFGKLNEISFPRQSSSDETRATLVAFCDASKQAYGFTVYAIQNGQTKFFFSKVKVSPLHTRTLPTLRLLSVLLCLNCVSSMLLDQNIKHTQLASINILTDSQVALSWILKGHALKKNIFVSNRLKDISEFLKILHKEKNFDIQFHLVTRDISLKCFLEHFTRSCLDCQTLL